MKLTSNHRAWLPHNRATAVAALFAVASSAAVFLPLLTAYFHGDDFLHLYQLVNYDLLTNLVIPHGGHVYAVRNFIFFLCWRLFGMEPFGYFALALVTHLVNVALLCAVIHRLTGSNLLAAFGAALWGTSPVQAGVLEWYSVYGHALATTVLLVLLYQIAGFVRDGGTPSRRRRWAWFAIAIGGTTCFGVGLAVALVLPFVIVLFLPGRYRWWRPPLLSLLVVVPALYMLLLRAYELAWRTDLQIVMMGPQLVALSGFGLPLAVWEVMSYGVARLFCGLACTGDAAHRVSVGIASGIAAAFLVAVVAVAVRDRRTRPALFACGLLAVAIYGIIATARGFFFLAHPDLLHMATRYHYAALVPVTIAVCVALHSAGRRLALPPGVSMAVVVLWALGSLTALLMAPAWLRLDADERQDAGQFVAAMRSAAADPSAGATVYVRNRMFRPMLSTGPFFPKMAGAFTLYFSGDSIDGKRFYFLEPSDEMRAWNAYGIPINRLLIDPKYVPRDAVVH